MLTSAIANKTVVGHCKTFSDAEAKVTGHVPGKGKNTGMMGALKCVMASGKVHLRVYSQISTRALTKIF